MRGASRLMRTQRRNVLCNVTSVGLGMWVWTQRLLSCVWDAKRPVCELHPSEGLVLETGTTPHTWDCVKSRTLCTRLNS